MLSGIPAAVPDVRACMTLQLLIRLTGNTEVNQLMFVYLTLEPLQHIFTWLFQIISI